MADEVTDKEVDQARARVDKLREQKAELQLKISANATAAENAYKLANLSAEEERLKAEVDQLKELAKPKVQQAVTDSVVEQVSEGTAGSVPDKSAVLPER